jgi:hypothetical protein
MNYLITRFKTAYSYLEFINQETQKAKNAGFGSRD